MVAVVRDVDGEEVNDLDIQPETGWRKTPPVSWVGARVESSCWSSERVAFHSVRMVARSGSGCGRTVCAELGTLTLLSD